MQVPLPRDQPLLPTLASLAFLLVFEKFWHQHIRERAKKLLSSAKQRQEVACYHSGTATFRPKESRANGLVPSPMPKTSTTSEGKCGTIHPAPIVGFTLDIGSSTYFGHSYTAPYNTTSSYSTVTCSGALCTDIIGGTIMGASWNG